MKAFIQNYTVSKVNFFFTSFLSLSDVLLYGDGSSTVVEQHLIVITSPLVLPPPRFLLLFYSSLCSDALFIILMKNTHRLNYPLR